MRSFQKKLLTNCRVCDQARSTISFSKVCLCQKILPIPRPKLEELHKIYFLRIYSEALGIFWEQFPRKVSKILYASAPLTKMEWPTKKPGTDITSTNFQFFTVCVKIPGQKSFFSA